MVKFQKSSYSMHDTKKWNGRGIRIGRISRKIYSREKKSKSVRAFANALLLLLILYSDIWRLGIDGRTQTRFSSFIRFIPLLVCSHMHAELI